MHVGKIELGMNTRRITVAALLVVAYLVLGAAVLFIFDRSNPTFVFDSGDVHLSFGIPRDTGSLSTSSAKRTEPGSKHDVAVAFIMLKPPGNDKFTVSDVVVLLKKADDSKIVAKLGLD